METSACGAETVAGRIAIDLAVELRYDLRMLGTKVKGTTVLFGDNRSMITNASLPHSTLKKRKSANDHHRVREAVAAGIASVVHVDTKYNLADMGTKSLNGQTHQFLLKNQVPPPVSTAGECKPESGEKDLAQSGKVGQAKLHLSVLSPLDRDVHRAMQDPEFREHVSDMQDWNFQSHENPNPTA